MAYTDSEPGYLDLPANFDVRYLDSTPGFLDLEPNYQRPVLFWKIVGGIRVPLFARGGLSPAQWRRTLVPGEFFPDETTTGVYDESVLVDNETEYLQITEPGAYFENQRFLGRVDVRAPNVHFRNCQFIGPAYRENGVSVFVATSLATVNCLVEDCTFSPRFHNERTNCIMAFGVTFRRCRMDGGVDNIGISSYGSGELEGRSNVVIEGCWANDMFFFSPCSYQSDNVTHNDVIQWHGGAGVTIIGNRLESTINPSVGDAAGPGPGGISEDEWLPGGQLAPSPLYPETQRFGAVLMISPRLRPHQELVFEKNWLDHGTVGINGTGSATVGDFSYPGSTIKDNWIGVDWFLSQPNDLTPENGHGILIRNAHQIEVSGNVTWDKADPFNRNTSPARIRYWG